LKFLKLLKKAERKKENAAIRSYKAANKELLAHADEVIAELKVLSKEKSLLLLKRLVKRT
jgi:hypothetical protein